MPGVFAGWALINTRKHCTLCTNSGNDVHQSFRRSTKDQKTPHQPYRPFPPLSLPNLCNPGHFQFPSLLYFLPRIQRPDLLASGGATDKGQLTPPTAHINHPASHVCARRHRTLCLQCDVSRWVLPAIYPAPSRAALEKILRTLPCKKQSFAFSLIPIT